MRISYLDGMDVCLAEVNKITLKGSTLVCQLASLDADGKPEIIIRPFPDPDTCEQFFREVICAGNPDKVINLENTNFNTRLAEMWDEFDKVFYGEE